LVTRSVAQLGVRERSGGADLSVLSGICYVRTESLKVSSTALVITS